MILIVIKPHISHYLERNQSNFKTYSKTKIKWVQQLSKKETLNWKPILHAYLHILINVSLSATESTMVLNWELLIYWYFDITHFLIFIGDLRVKVYQVSAVSASEMIKNNNDLSYFLSPHFSWKDSILIVLYNFEKYYKDRQSFACQWLMTIITLKELLEKFECLKSLIIWENQQRYEETTCVFEIEDTSGACFITYNAHFWPFSDLSTSATQYV